MKRKKIMKVKQIYFHLFNKYKKVEPNPIVLPNNGPQIEPQPGYRLISSDSLTSLPDIEAIKAPSSIRFHTYNLKLAITKALMEIIDEQKSTYNTVIQISKCIRR